MSDPRAEAVQFLLRQQQAVDDARRGGDLAAQAQALLALGLLRHYRGEQEQAFARLEEGLALAEEVGDAGLIYQAQLRLADVHFRLGEIAQANILYQSVLQNAQQNSHQAAEAGALYGLGMIAIHAQGKEAAGQVFLQQAKTLGYVSDSAPYPTINGRMSDAELEAARDSAVRLGSRYAECQCLIMLGERRANNALTRREARPIYEDALRIAREGRFRFEELRVRLLLADQDYDDNYYVRYAEVYQDVLEQYLAIITLAREIGQRQSEARALLAATTCADHLHQYAKAREFLTQAAAIYTDLGDLRALRRVNRRLWFSRVSSRMGLLARLRRRLP